MRFKVGDKVFHDGDLGEISEIDYERGGLELPPIYEISHEWGMSHALDGDENLVAATHEMIFAYELSIFASRFEELIKLCPCDDTKQELIAARIIVMQVVKMNPRP